MTDIVERLRARKGFWLNGAAWMMGTKPDTDCAEAADEIERLRRALERIRDDYNVNHSSKWCQCFAAEALAAQDQPASPDVRAESSKQYRDAVDRVNRATDAEINASLRTAKRENQ